MNNLTIAGRVGKDAQVRTTNSGEKVAGWSVAVNEGKDQTTWFDCSMFGDRAEKLAQYITKGSSIAVSGRVSMRVYEGKGYLQCIVGQVTFLSSKAEREHGSAPREDSRQNGYGAGGVPGRSGGGGYGDLEDTIPFAPEWR